MNSSQAAAGIGGSSLTAALATVIEYWQGLTEVGVAAAEATLLVILIGAAGGWLRWFMAGREGPPPPSIVNGMSREKV